MWEVTRRDHIGEALHGSIASSVDGRSDEAELIAHDAAVVDSREWDGLTQAVSSGAMALGSSMARTPLFCQ